MFNTHRCKLWVLAHQFRRAHADTRLELIDQQRTIGHVIEQLVYAIEPIRADKLSCSDAQDVAEVEDFDFQGEAVQLCI